MLKESKELTKYDYVSFTCDCCKKEFVLSEFLLRYHLSSELIPILKYPVPTNNNDLMVYKHFCSNECLYQLLKDVPFSYEVKFPVTNFDKE